LSRKSKNNCLSVLYLVTEDWYFWSHRLAIARAVRDSGVRVIVATRVRDFGERIRAEGFELHSLPWRRRGDGLFGGLCALVAIIRLYIAKRPGLVHHVGLKPVVFGSFAAFVARVPRQINMLAGLGFVFVSPTILALVQRSLILLALEAFVNRGSSEVIIQNREDGEELSQRGAIDARRLRLIAGSGVDIARFSFAPEPLASPIVIAMVSRMLRYKGVTILVEAAREIRKRGLSIRILLVGPVDADNPSSLREAELRAWHNEGIIEWLGPTDDVPAVWARAHIAVFPSMYREGVPKTVLEAAACGRPVITTDIPGCRDIVDDGRNGLLVPPGDAKRLAAAMITLAENPALRASMGREGRRKVELLFSERSIVAQTMRIYSNAFGQELAFPWKDRVTNS
jgi:glycosyltransferase involved in cell wall biosynthesis